MHPGSGVHGKHGFQQMSELHQFPGAVFDREVIIIAGSLPVDVDQPGCRDMGRRL